jgi:hypothetical protein
MARSPALSTEVSRVFFFFSVRPSQAGHLSLSSAEVKNVFRHTSPHSHFVAWPLLSNVSASSISEIRTATKFIILKVKGKVPVLS